MNIDNLEIERKFLIAMPDLCWLSTVAESTEITQTYLRATPLFSTNRVRKRGRGGVYTYTHTRKQHITDVTRVELEDEISEREYLELLSEADPERHTIQKTRYCLDYAGQTFEIDIFPFWTTQAYMELEMQTEDQKIEFPPQIRILREVTADPRYNNSELARAIPAEDAFSETSNLTWKG